MPIIETTEENIDELLKTRWYNNDYTTAKNAVLEFAKENQAILLDVNDEYQEILMNFHCRELFVKFTEYNNMIAIDIRIEAGLFNKKKNLIFFYEQINKNLNFLGLGLLSEEK